MHRYACLGIFQEGPRAHRDPWWIFNQTKTRCQIRIEYNGWEYGVLSDHRDRTGPFPSGCKWVWSNGQLQNSGKRPPSKNGKWAVVSIKGWWVVSRMCGRHQREEVIRKYGNSQKQKWKFSVKKGRHRPNCIPVHEAGYSEQALLIPSSTWGWI